MKVVGIVGSPRIPGNTHYMVSWVLGAAAGAGAETQAINLVEKHIAPCRACESCGDPPNRCAQEDDMASIIDALASADAVVMGTPVYGWGPSAWIKSMIDRWYGLRGEYSGTLRNKRVGLVIPLGDSNPKTAQHTIGVFRDSFGYLGARLADPILAPGCGERDDVTRLTGVREKCEELGRLLVTP